MKNCSVIVLRFLACTVLLATSVEALAYMEDNLLVRYDFNKGRGTSVSDQTGLGYTANLQGDATFINNDPWEESTGKAKFGNAIKFDGAGDYLDIDSKFHNAKLNVDKLAITAWIRPVAVGVGKQYLVSKLSHKSKTGYALAIDNRTGYLHAEIYLNGSRSVSEAVSSIAPPNHTWTHVAVSFDGSSIQLYLNGTPDTSTSANGSIAASTKDFTIGALSQRKPSKGFSGAIDELRIYSSISSANVRILAEAEGGEPGLILYESFDTINRISFDAGFTGASFKYLDETDLVQGQFDNALHFQNDGQESERLNWPVLNNLDSAKGHITLWFRPDWAGNSNGGNSILETNNGGLANYRSGDGIRVYRWNGSKGDKEFRLLARNNYVTSNHQEPAGILSWQPNEWHYLELIWDTTGEIPFLAYVIDGEIASINDEATIPASGIPLKLFLGSRNSWNGMAGTIDELKVYSEPQYNVFNNAEKIAAITQSNRADGKIQPYETVHNSADAPFPEKANKAKKGILFFQTAPFEPVYAGYLPDKAEISNLLSYNTAKNNTESLFFNIYSQEDIDDVSINISDLKNARGRTVVAAEEMKLMVVKKWWQRAGPGLQEDTFIPVFVPELLMYDDRYNFKHDDYDIGSEASHSWDNLPDFPIPSSASVKTELKSYTSKQFMLNIKIPDTAVTGTYEATATLTGAGVSGSRVLTLKINVHDINLPKADKDFIIFHRAQYLGSPDKYTLYDFVSDKNYYLAELQDIADHGFNGIFTYGAEQDYIADIAAAGFDGKIIMRGAAANSLTVAAMKQNFGEAWFYGEDEPSNNVQLESQMYRSSAIHAIGGNAATAIKLPWADCLRNPRRLRPDPENQGVLTDFCPYTGDQSFSSDTKLDMENLNVYSPSGNTQEHFYSLLNNTTTKDKNQQSYYWQSRVEDARVNRYLAGFHLYLTDLDGIWPYVYIHKDASDPFDDLDSDPAVSNKTRDIGTVYPTQQGPMSTIQWEAMREGIDDYRYLQLWQSLHDKVLPENPSEAARSKARIEINEHGIGLSLFRYQLLGTLNLSNADFNATRELIAEEIQALKYSLRNSAGG